jgi:hypothetical protein
MLAAGLEKKLVDAVVVLKENKRVRGSSDSTSDVSEVLNSAVHCILSQATLQVDRK